MAAGELHHIHGVRHRSGHRRDRSQHEQRHVEAPTASCARGARRPHQASAWRSTSRGRSGTRSLIVPVIKDAGTMNFAEFVAAYEGLIKKVATTSSRST
ncbi:MAG: hypothetical protein R2710_05180 [Acidimicrobiales bacterium]